MCQASTEFQVIHFVSRGLELVMKSRFGQKCSRDWCKNDWSQVERAVVSCKPHFLLNTSWSRCFSFLPRPLQQTNIYSFPVRHCTGWACPPRLHSKDIDIKRPLHFLPHKPSICLLLFAVVWYLPGLVWSFGCVADGDGRALLDSFFRRFASGQLQTNDQVFLMRVIWHCLTNKDPCFGWHRDCQLSARTSWKLRSHYCRTMFGSKGGLPTSRRRARTWSLIETFHDINLATVVEKQKMWKTLTLPVAQNPRRHPASRTPTCETGED